MTVLSQAKHSPPQTTQKWFIEIENDQYGSHANACTVYVRISYQHQLNPSIIVSTVKFINEIF